MTVEMSFQLISWTLCLGLICLGCGDGWPTPPRHQQTHKSGPAVEATNTRTAGAPASVPARLADSDAELQRVPAAAPSAPFDKPALAKPVYIKQLVSTDIVQLKSGKSFTGKIVEEDAKTLVLEKVDGARKTIPRSRVAGVMRSQVDVGREIYNAALADYERQVEQRKRYERQVKQRAQSLRPDHKFNPSTRPRRGRSQLRAIVNCRTLTKAEFMETAVRLCRKYESRAAGSFLVQFFSDASCLQGWDGTGGLRESDWPHWLCRVSVNTDANGQLYARTFKLAVDSTSGQERTDVLKK